MIELATNYLGLRLKNPLVVGASPLTLDVGKVRQLEDAGAAAVVLPSLFQEEIEHDVAAHHHFAELGTHSYAEALSYTPRVDYAPRRLEEYAEHVSNVKAAVGIPVIASLNGATLGGWTDYARMLEEAGADALELNVYAVASDPDTTAMDIENGYIDILNAVKGTVSLPVALKLGPYFSAFAHFAKRLDEQGVDGLVLFNRFYQPDIDLEALEVVPDLSFSAAHEMRLPLRWIAILDAQLEASLAATTGVYNAHDVLKLLMVGADAVMLVAAVFRHGPRRITEILQGLEDWMQLHEYESVHQMQGSLNQRACSHPAAFERANYLRALQSFA